MRKLFLAVNHCLSIGVIHRDLNPENIMYKESSILNGHDLNEVKIIDFGLSKMMLEPHSDKLNTLVGTPYYVAPEVLAGQYGYECDCWSLGVIMYVTLSGCLPFFGSSPIEVFDQIKSA